MLAAYRANGSNRPHRSSRRTQDRIEQLAQRRQAHWDAIATGVSPSEASLHSEHVRRLTQELDDLYKQKRAEVAPFTVIDDFSGSRRNVE